MPERKSRLKLIHGKKEAGQTQSAGLPQPYPYTHPEGLPSARALPELQEIYQEQSIPDFRNNRATYVVTLEDEALLCFETTLMGLNEDGTIAVIAVGVGDSTFVGLAERDQEHRRPGTWHKSESQLAFEDSIQYLTYEEYKQRYILPGLVEGARKRRLKQALKTGEYASYGTD